eukprot:TRINITY_DN164_c0_g2_i3.p1 TRINITY_DN164_c0_g2~~TRINITY_DN164_c0_g2_i3.p1  ORF type:complete len:222 (-),score=67.26 TRINITY_DN164_c0_g2_i3:463-1128(-)
MSKKVYTKEQWEQKLNDVKISKQDLNKIVMNYLIVEGYKEAAEAFVEESNTEPNCDLDDISERMKIRNAIQQGNIEEGIEYINDLDPEILDTNPDLIFSLKQQQLIEMIRNNKIDEALIFAQEEIAPKGLKQKEFLEEIERTMALFAFSEENQSDSPVGELLSNNQRQKIASKLNSAILQSQCQDKDSKLPTFLKLLTFSQNRLEEKVKFPKLNLDNEFEV